MLVGHPRPTTGSYPARPVVLDVGSRSGELEYSLSVRLSSSSRLSVAHHQRAFPHIILVGVLVGWQVPRLVFGKRVDLPGLERRYGVAREGTAERGRQGRDLGCRLGLSSGQHGEEVGQGAVDGLLERQGDGTCLGGRLGGEQTDGGADRGGEEESEVGQRGRAVFSLLKTRDADRRYLFRLVASRRNRPLTRC